MRRASVTRLFRKPSSSQAVLLVETAATREKFRMTVSAPAAGILALEGHGLNDRCSLYRLLMDCVSSFGASLTSAVVHLDPSHGVTGAISVSLGEDVSWIEADVVELVALALHATIPIYLDLVDGDEIESESSASTITQLPTVFEDALAEIVSSRAGEAPTAPPLQPHCGQEFHLDLDTDPRDE